MYTSSIMVVVMLVGAYGQLNVLKVNLQFFARSAGYIGVSKN